MTSTKRVLGLFDATSMVTGNMIGSGIFLLAGYAAAPVPNDITLIMAWIAGGAMALLGAFAIAELSTRFPETGGDFIYLHKVFGPFPAFLYGWMSLVIFETGSIAILALFSAKYIHQFFSWFYGVICPDASHHFSIGVFRHSLFKSRGGISFPVYPNRT